VNPRALVSTVAPPIVLVFSALADEAAPDAALGDALAVPPELGDELPHAATLSVAAITAAEASQPVRHGCLPRPEAARLRVHRAASRSGPGLEELGCLITVLLLLSGSPAAARTPSAVGVHVTMCTSIPAAPRIIDLIVAAGRSAASRVWRGGAEHQLGGIGHLVVGAAAAARSAATRPPQIPCWPMSQCRSDSARH